MLPSSCPRVHTQSLSHTCTCFRTHLSITLPHVYIPPRFTLICTLPCKSTHAHSPLLSTHTHSFGHTLIPVYTLTGMHIHVCTFTQPCPVPEGGVAGQSCYPCDAWYSSVARDKEAPLGPGRDRAHTHPDCPLAWHTLTPAVFCAVHVQDPQCGREAGAEAGRRSGTWGTHGVAEVRELKEHKTNKCD